LAGLRTLLCLVFEVDLAVDVDVFLKVGLGVIGGLDGATIVGFDFFFGDDFAFKFGCLITFLAFGPSIDAAVFTDLREVFCFFGRELFISLFFKFP